MAGDEPSPGADVVGVSPVPVQMWAWEGGDAGAYMTRAIEASAWVRGRRVLEHAAEYVLRTLCALCCGSQRLRHVVPRRKEKNWMPFAHSRAGKESL